MLCYIINLFHLSISILFLVIYCKPPVNWKNYSNSQQLGQTLNKLDQLRTKMSKVGQGYKGRAYFTEGLPISTLFYASSVVCKTSYDILWLNHSRTSPNFLLNQISY